jgi:hypothetical protein
MENIRAFARANIKPLADKNNFSGCEYGGQPSRNDRDNPGMGISVPCPGEEVNGMLSCPGIQVNSVSVELFYT